MTWFYKHFNQVLFLQPGIHWLDYLVVNYSPVALTFIPRTTWMFVQGITGVDATSHMDIKRMPMMARNDVGGTSSRNIAHWQQLARTGKVESFAIDEAERVPYDVSKLAVNLRSTELLLFRGTTDKCVVEEDFAKLVPLLPAEQIADIVIVDDYDHLDYMWAKEVETTINQKLLDFIKAD